MMDISVAISQGENHVFNLPDKNIIQIKRPNPTFLSMFAGQWIDYLRHIQYWASCSSYNSKLHARLIWELDNKDLDENVISETCELWDAAVFMNEIRTRFNVQHGTFDLRPHPLPQGMYVWGLGLAQEVWAHGVRRMGERFGEEADAHDVDLAIQQALFSEQRYG